MRTQIFELAVVIALGLGGTVACGEPFRCSAACLEAAGGASDVANGDVDPPGCTGDARQSPRCLIATEPGIFVSIASGDDATGDGSRGAPFATITRALAVSGARNVYVCSTSDQEFYREELALAPAQDGVRLIGGYACADWAYSAQRRVPVKSTAGTGLRIHGLLKGAVIEGFEIAAAAVEGASTSSYGAFIVDSVNVTLRRVSLVAAAGGPGAEGTAGADGRDGAAGAGQNGLQASCIVLQRNRGGVALSSPWGSRGGDGGHASDLDPLGAKATGGGDGLPRGDDAATGTGGIADPAGVSRGIGAPGTPGFDGKNGAFGERAPASPVFAVAGFFPLNGLDGEPGKHGQGGGGGGGGSAQEAPRDCTPGSGGAGGMGGQAGQAGGGGAGGGASIGLFAWDSKVRLEASHVAAGQGGAGGKGGVGGRGGAGAAGGKGGEGTGGGSLPAGGDGGHGGRGGSGGPGSGGSGGPSLAVAVHGTDLVLDSTTTFAIQVGGEGGSGGALGDAVAPSGGVGMATLRFDVP